MSVMTEQTLSPDRRLTRPEISAAISGLGWRLVVGSARTHVRTGSLAQAAAVAGRLVAAAGPGADQALRADIRPDRVILNLCSLAVAGITPAEVGMAERISAAARELGLATAPDTEGAGGAGGSRSAQMIEIGIDALDGAAIRPFWAAVLGYGDEPGTTVAADSPLVDLLGEGPAIWFQQMDEPRRQRNRIHFDIGVPHDEAPRRIAAALAAGGTLLSDARAPAFWVLADAEGNEVCITTWQGRDG
jgi:4a-hydroxytetrahydrobiopterin dehydratase